jgi:hypothetical protein
MPVIHKKFGKGTIRLVSPKLDIIEIFFDNTGSKIFSLKTCISGNLIKILDTSIVRKYN